MASKPNAAAPYRVDPVVETRERSAISGKSFISEEGFERLRNMPQEEFDRRIAAALKRMRQAEERRQLLTETEVSENE